MMLVFHTVAPPTHVRWMVERDMPAVMALEARCFAEPWTRDEFTDVRRRRNCISFVAASNEWDVAGYMVYEIHRDHVTLLTLGVAPECRRRGVGVQMLDRAKTKLWPGRRPRLIADTRESNLPAHLFFRAAGFRCVQVRRDFYGTGEAAYRFEFVHGGRG